MTNVKAQMSNKAPNPNDKNEEKRITRFGIGQIFFTLAISQKLSRE